MSAKEQHSYKVREMSWRKFMGLSGNFTSLFATIS